MASPVLWLVRVLALAALAGSWWLTIQKWLAPRISIAGCGGSEGCATLLDSRWSQWFFVPVTLLAATVWLAVLLLTLPGASRHLGRTADQLLAACAVLLLSGALWFGFLMAFMVKVWCPWCAALHAAAVVVGAILLYSTWKVSQDGERGLLAAAGQAGIAGAALLVLGQLFGKVPDTHLLTVEPASPVASAGPISLSKSVAWLNGALVLPRWELPSLGSPDALHVLAGFSDYTCTACRAQHSDLKALLKSAPGAYAVVILHTPLDRSCNPHLPSNAPDHPNACALARLALALWTAAPDQFPDFHDFLMTAPLPLDPGTAMQEARRLVPQATLAPEIPAITQRIAQNAAAWQQLSSENTKLPKLILRDEIVLHGSTANRERFMEIIAETFAPVVSEGIPVSLPQR